jgi:hypothetical protein
MWFLLGSGRPRSVVRLSYAIAAPAVTGPVPFLEQDNMSHLGRWLSEREVSDDARNNAVRGRVLL